MNAARKPRYLAKSIATLLAGYFLLDASSIAQPKGQQVVNGQASFDLRGKDMTIKASDRSIINYKSFDIGKGEKVQFIQPNSGSRVLNRVTGADPTHIFGMLQANGQVYLVNAAGIFFANGSVINVGSLIAAAGHMSDQDFLAGRNLFTNMTGDVVNRGSITSVGDVGLFGASVSNFGTINSQTGVVAMLAGDQVLYGEKGSNIFVGSQPAVATASAAKPGVRNAGTITAPKAMLGAGDMYAMAVVNSGTITSPDITVQGGKGGQVVVGGTLDASVRTSGQKGGKIKLLGDKIALRAATLDASGAAGGGEILVGGDTHGGNGVKTASTTSVDKATTIKADALVNGDGGKVVVWSDVQTDFAGSISAKGAGTGMGGFAEVSGKSLLNFTGNVDLSAPSGVKGTLLLDPSTINIQTAGADDVTQSGSNPKTVTGNSATSILTVSTLQSLLAGANVIVDATGGPGAAAAPAINVLNNVTWATGSTLTLTAGTGGIVISAVISATGGGGVVLNSGAGINETGAGAIQASTLTTASVSGQTLNGANSVNTFNATNTASGNIALTNTAATLTVTGINQAGTGTATVNNAGTLTTTGAVTTTGTGTLTLQSTGTLTIGAPVTATAGPATIVLISTASNLVMNDNVNAGNGGVALSAANGTITQAGGKLVIAKALGVAATAEPTMTLGSSLDTLAANITGANSPFTYIQGSAFSVGTVGPISGVTTNNGIVNLMATSGDLTLSQGVNAGTAAVNLTAGGGAISETAAGTVHGGLLTASSATGTVLGGSNTVSSFTATNTTSGNITLTNTAATLTVTGISQAGSGTTTVNNTGALTTTGAVTTTGTGTLTLQASGTETIGAAVTASAGPATIVLTSTGGNLVLNDNVNAGTGGVALSAPTGTITQAGGKTVTAKALGIAALAVPTLTTSGSLDTLAANITGAGSPFSFTQAGSFSIGTVGPISGVTTNNGVITLTASSGNLSLLQGVNAGTAAVNLNATTGSISETGAGVVSGGLLTTTSATGTVLDGSNTVSGFHAANTTSGNISLTNTVATVTVTGINQAGTGTTTVNNTGALTTSGLVTTTGTGTITLQASGDETIGAAITATAGPAAVVLTSTAGNVIVNAAINSGSLQARVNDPTKSIRLSAPITTSGDQDYIGDVVLTADETLTGVNVIFEKTVSSSTFDGFGLTVNASGATTFKGSVGGEDRDNNGVLDASHDIVTAGGHSFAQTEDANANGILDPGLRLKFLTTNAAGTLVLGGGTTAIVEINSKAITFGETVTIGGGSTTGIVLATTQLAATTIDPQNKDVSLFVDGAFTANSVSAPRNFTVGGYGQTNPGDILSGSGWNLNTNTYITSGFAVSGNQTYYVPVLLSTNATFSSSGAGTLAFLQTVDSSGANRSLTLNTTGDVIFKGKVGGALALLSLQTDLGGRTIIDVAGTPAITTTTFQHFGDNMLLGRDTVLQAGGDVTFDGTVNADASGGLSERWTLAVNTPGVTWFKGDVGGTNALGALTTDYQAGAGEKTLFGNGSMITVVTQADTRATHPITGLAHLTTGDQIYNDDVVLKADTTLTAQLNGIVTPNVTFARTVNSDATGGASNLWALTVNAPGVTSFQGDVGTATTGGQLGALTTDAAGSTALGNGAATIHFPGSVQTGSTITIQTKSDGTTAAAAHNGNQTFGDDVTLLADTTNVAQLNGTVNPGVTFGKTVNSNTSALWALTVNAPGVTWFQGNVGMAAGGQLGALTTDYNPAVGVANGEETRLGNGSAITIVTKSDGTTAAALHNGDQNFNDDVKLWADATNEAQLNGTVNPNVTFARTVNSNTNALRALTVNAPGVTWFQGDVGTATGGQLGTLTTDYQAGASEATRLGNGATTVHYPGTAQTSSTITVTTSGDQTYNDDVEVGAIAALNGTNVTFARTVNSDTTGWSGGTLWTLGVNASGKTWFQGNVGTVAALGALTTDAPGVTWLGNGAATVQLPRNPLLDSKITIRTQSDGTTAAAVRNGDQTFGDDVMLLADTTNVALLNGTVNPNVTYGRTVNSDTTGTSGTLWALFVKAPGVTWFKGDVGTGVGAQAGTLGALTTDFQVGLTAEETRLGNGALTIHYPGTVQPVNSVTIQTKSDGTTAGAVHNGDQTYGDDVKLWADTTVNAILNGAVNPNVTFARSVNSDTTTGAGSSGGSLWTLRVNSPGITWFQGDVGTAPVGGAGTQAGTLGALITDFQVGLTAEETRLGNGALTIHYPGTVQLPNSVAINTKVDLTAGHVTTGEQTYNDDVKLWADTTVNAILNGAVNPNVTFARTVNSDTTTGAGSSGGSLWTLRVNSPGITWFQGDVGTAPVGGAGTQAGTLGALITDFQVGEVNGEETRLGNGASTIRYPGTVQPANSVTIQTQSDGTTAVSLHNGDQTFGDDVKLLADTTNVALLNGTVNPNVTYGRTVNSDTTGGGGALWALTVKAPGVTWFKGDIGTATGGQLGALTTDYQVGLPPEETRLGNGILTIHYPGILQPMDSITIRTKSDGTTVAALHNGNQNFNDDVKLWADATNEAQLNGAVNPNVTFARTVNSDTTGGGGALWTLTVKAPGITWFQGDVGTATGGQLGALTTDFQVGLTAEETRLGNGILTIHYPGILQPVDSITVRTKSDGTTAAAVHNGDQTFGDDVKLWADATNDAQLNGTVKPNVTFVRTVNSDTTTGAGSSGGQLWKLTVDAPGITWFKGDVGTAPVGGAGTQAGTLGALITDFQVGEVNGEETRLGNGAATIRYPGTVQPVNSITIDTKIDLTAGHVTTGEQSYGDDVKLWADTITNTDRNGVASLTYPQAAVTFGGTVNSDTTGGGGALWTLTVNAPGVTWFKGDIGTATGGQLGALTTDYNPAVGFANGEKTVLGNEGATVHYPGSAQTGNTITILTKSDATRSGNQTYNDDVEVWADAKLWSQSGAGDAVQPNITFNRLLDSHVGIGVHDLTAVSYGNEIFNGVVGGRMQLKNLVTDELPSPPGVRGGSAIFNITVTEPGLTNPAGVTAWTVTTNDNNVVFNVQNGTPSVQTTAGSQTYNSHGLVETSAILKSAGDVLFHNPDISAVGSNQTILAVDASPDGVNMADGLQTLNVQATNLVQFNGAVGGGGRLHDLTTSGNSTEFNVPTAVPALTFPINVKATWHPAWVNVTGNVTVTGGVVFNVPGSNSVNNTVETGSNQSYFGPATLQQDTYVHSNGSGNILFDQTIDGPRNLVITAGGKAQLNGNVTIASLDVTGQQIELAAHGAITILTTGTQTYRSDVVLKGDVTATSTTGKAILFKGKVDGNQDLTVRSNNGVVTFIGTVGGDTALDTLKVNAADIFIPDVSAKNASLDATDLLTLTGTKYKTDSTLAFNPTARAGKTGSATIIKQTGNLSIDAGSFVMGQEQKLLVDNGSLTIDAGSASVGDMAASVAMTLDINSLTILGRPAGGFTNSGRQDEGVSFVSPTITFNGNIAGVAPGGKVNFGTVSGLVGGGNNVFGVPGVSVLLQQDLANQFHHPGTIPGSLLQPIAGGLVTTLNSQVTPVVPVTFDLPRPFLFETDPRISAALIDELRRLGINAREPNQQETISINIRQGVFNQPKDFIDLFAPDLKEDEDKGYEVVVNRITNQEAKRVTKLFNQIGGTEGLAAMKQSIEEAAEKFAAETKAESINGEQFVAWLQSSTDPAAKQGLSQVQKLASLFNEIGAMGLTEPEIERSEKIITGSVGTQNLSPKELKAAINKLQSTVPKKTLEVLKKKSPDQASTGTPETTTPHADS